MKVHLVKIFIICFLYVITLFGKDNLPLIIYPVSSNDKLNTLVSFQNACNLKEVAGISTYVRRTLDGVLICFDDSNTSNLFNVSKEIKDITFTELEKLAALQGKKIVKFSDVLKLLPKEKMLFMEVAFYDSPWRFYDKHFLKSFLKVIKQSKIDKNQLAVISADQWALREIRVAMPEIKTFFFNKLVKKHNRKDYTTGNFRTVQEKLRTSSFHGSALFLKDIDLKAEEIALLFSREQELCIWNTNEKFDFLACAMANYVRISNIEKFLTYKKVITQKRNNFTGKASNYTLIKPYNINKLPIAPTNKRNENPYANLNWKKIQQIHTTSHAHCAKGPALANWLRRKPHPMKFVTLSNYHPASPTYPYNKVNKENYRILNFNHELVVNGKVVNGPFDWNKIISQWQDELTQKGKKNFPIKLGGPIIKPDVLPSGIPEAPNAEHSHFTDSYRHICAPGSMYASGMFDLKNDYKLLNKGYVHGTGQPWKQVFKKIFDQLLIKDGGGITINHPHYPVSYSCTVPELVELLDFDHRVLGIEIFNLNSVEFDNPCTGWATDLWDAVLKTGRQCYAFSVPDHCNFRAGHNVLLVEELTQEACLKAYRQGKFYCAIWGQSTSFTNISFENGVFSAQVDNPCDMKIISGKGVIVSKKGVSSISINTNTIDKKEHVYLRIEAKDKIGEQLFTQAVILK